MVSQGSSGVFADLGRHFCMHQLHYPREVQKPDVLEPPVSFRPPIEPTNIDACGEPEGRCQRTGCAVFRWRRACHVPSQTFNAKAHSLRYIEDAPVWTRL
ncbi:hypothetical protein PMIN06_010394 [Paraphaeosphaeria minitans]